MASSGSWSEGSSGATQSAGGSSEDLKQLMDQRKRKRMISNRESARRSRMKKQKQLDDLAAQVALLSRERQQIATAVNITTQELLAVEAENAVLSAQAGELSRRLDSLNEIIAFLGAGESGDGGIGLPDDFFSGEMAAAAAESFLNPWNLMALSQQQPITASANVFPY